MAKIKINMMSGEVDRKRQTKIVGIDLGTTNSLIATYQNGAPVIMVDACRNTINVPSAIHFDHTGKPEIGKNAKIHRIDDPQNTVYSVKRLIGKSYKEYTHTNTTLNYQIVKPLDEDKLVEISIRNKYYTPVELSAIILAQIAKLAEDGGQCTINQAVITVPAYFDDAQRQATRDAGKLAGLEVLRIINEPTAAALAYGHGLDKNEHKVVAVYDLGGGTFDMSILEINNGIIEVLSTHGDIHLGGDDIDNDIVELWIKKYNLKSKDFPINQLISLAELAKISISNFENWKYHWLGIDLELNESELYNVSQKLIAKTLTCCNKAITDAQLELSQIDDILLVGGSTRMPSVRNAVKKFFNKSPNTSLNPDEAIVLGAAIQAEIISGKKRDLFLLDITPLSLGVETIGGLMDVLIPRNNKIPFRTAKHYTTSVDGQKNLKVAVYQGEREFVKDNRLLGEFILKNIPPMPAGLPKIEITFGLNMDGILIVNAKELRSETKAEIEIRSQYSLSEENMSEILLDSIQKGGEDLQQRLLIETQIEAQQQSLALKKFIKANNDSLSYDVIAKLENYDAQLNDDNILSSREKIKDLMVQLNEYSIPFAQNALELSIKSAIKGKNINTNLTDY